MLVFPDADHNEIGLVPSGTPFEHISVVRHFTREHFVKETLDGSTNWFPAVIFSQSPDVTVEMFCVEHHGLPINARPFYRFRGRPLSHRNIVAPQNSAGTATHDKATSTIFDKLFNKVRWIKAQMTFSNPVSTIYEQSHLVIVGVRIGNDLIGEAAHHRMTVLTSVDGCNGQEVLLPPSQKTVGKSVSIFRATTSRKSRTTFRYLRTSAPSLTHCSSHSSARKGICQIAFRMASRAFGSDSGVIFSMLAINSVAANSSKTRCRAWYKNPSVSSDFMISFATSLMFQSCLCRIQRYDAAISETIQVPSPVQSLLGGARHQPGHLSSTAPYSYTHAADSKSAACCQGL
jgi:hypothetical protein